MSPSVRTLMLAGMIVVSEAEAAAIRAAFEQCGEFVAAVELRRLFPAITDTAQARVCARDHRRLEAAARAAAHGKAAIPARFLRLTHSRPHSSRRHATPLPWSCHSARCADATDGDGQKRGALPMPRIAGCRSPPLPVRPGRDRPVRPEACGAARLRILEPFMRLPPSGCVVAHDWPKRSPRTGRGTAAAEYWPSAHGLWPRVPTVRSSASAPMQTKEGREGNPFGPFLSPVAHSSDGRAQGDDSDRRVGAQVGLYNHQTLVWSIYATNSCLSVPLCALSPQPSRAGPSE